MHSCSQSANLEIVMIKAEFGLLTASIASEEILICEKPKIALEIFLFCFLVLSSFNAPVLARHKFF